MIIKSMQIETVGACNLFCSMCPTMTYEEGKVLMSDDIFEKVLKFISDNKNNIKDINLSGWGEPLLDKKLAERIAAIKAVNSLIKVSITSNGTLLKEDRIYSILDSGIDHIRISFDAASKKTYEKIRIGADYDSVINNLKNLSILRNRREAKTNPTIFFELKNFIKNVKTFYRTRNLIDFLIFIFNNLKNPKKISKLRNKNKLHTTLSCNFIVMNENYSEIEDFVVLFHKLGFDYLTLSYTLHATSGNNKKESVSQLFTKKELSLKYKNIVKRFSGKIEVFDLMLYDVNIKKDCLFGAAGGRIVISCNGDVSPCCLLEHHIPYVPNPAKEDNFFSFGNVKNEEIEKIIDNNIYINFIQTFHNNNLPNICEGCQEVSKKISKNIIKII